jgi:hypothetical protein
MCSVAFILAGAAYAGDTFVADCEEFKATNGIEGDCDCMAEKASEAGVAENLSPLSKATPSILRHQNGP